MQMAPKNQKQNKVLHGWTEQVDYNSIFLYKLINHYNIKFVTNILNTQQLGVILSVGYHYNNDLYGKL